MEVYSLLLLALAVSMDSFSVGLTYGFRKLKIPFYSILIIACCSAIGLYVAAIFGKYISHILSPSVSETIGGSILIILGLWALYQFIRSPEEKSEKQSYPSTPKKPTVLKFEIKSVGIVIHILKKPISADLDKSGTITGWEAVLLGMALSLDAMGAGISASMLNIPAVLLSVAVGVMSACFAYCGIAFGSSIGRYKWARHFSLLPAILLIMIGLWRL